MPWLSLSLSPCKLFSLSHYWCEYFGRRERNLVKRWESSYWGSLLVLLRQLEARWIYFCAHWRRLQVQGWVKCLWWVHWKSSHKLLQDPTKYSSRRWCSKFSTFYKVASKVPYSPEILRKPPIPTKRGERKTYPLK